METFLLQGSFAGGASLGVVTMRATPGCRIAPGLASAMAPEKITCILPPLASPTAPAMSRRWQAANCEFTIRFARLVFGEIYM
jgi:hypothetical protein